MKDSDITKGWDIDARRLEEIKNTLLDGMIKAGLDKVMFRTTGDKLLRDKFVQKILSSLPEAEGVSDSWSKDAIIALMTSQRTNAIKRQKKAKSEPRSQTPTQLEPIVTLAPTFAPKQISESPGPTLLGKPLLLENMTFQFRWINSTAQDTIELCTIYDIIEANTETTTVKEIRFSLFQEVAASVGFNSNKGQIIWVDIESKEEARIARQGALQAAFQRCMLYHRSKVEFLLKSTDCKFY